MMDMSLFCHISVVQLGLLGQQKKNDDGVILHICNPNWILPLASISMDMV